MSDDDNKIHRLRVHKKPDPNSRPPLRVVRSFRCKHNNLLVDEDLAEVECEDCGERLNPVAVLARLAKDDDNLWWRREQLRKEVASYKDRLRFKCGACGQVNNITKPLRTRTRGE